MKAINNDNTITKRRRQNGVFEQYNSGCGYHRSCTGDDWQTNSRSPCKDNVAWAIKDCSRLNPAVCWDKDQNTQRLRNALSDAYLEGMTHWVVNEKPNIDCVYDANKIISTDALKVFGELYNTKDPNDPSKITYDNDFLELFERICLSTTNECNLDILTGKPFPKCTMLNSSGPNGSYCREIYNSLQDSKKDALINTICGREDLGECKCANRALTAEYKSVSLNQPMNDGCWWPACKSDSFLKPSNINTTDCPQNICQQVYYIPGAQQGVSIDNVQNVLNCPSISTKTESNTDVDVNNPAQPQPETKSQPETQPSQSPQSHSSLNKTAIIGISVGSVVFIILLMIVYLLKK